MGLGGGVVHLVPCKIKPVDGYITASLALTVDVYVAVAMWVMSLRWKFLAFQQRLQQQQNCDMCCHLCCCCGQLYTWFSLIAPMMDFASKEEKNQDFLMSLLQFLLPLKLLQNFRFRRVKKILLGPAMMIFSTVSFTSAQSVIIVIMDQQFEMRHDGSLWLNPVGWLTK